MQDMRSGARMDVRGRSSQNPSPAAAPPRLSLGPGSVRSAHASPLYHPPVCGLVGAPPCRHEKGGFVGASISPEVNVTEALVAAPPNEAACCCSIPAGADFKHAEPAGAGWRLLTPCIPSRRLPSVARSRPQGGNPRGSMSDARSRRRQHCRSSRRRNNKRQHRPRLTHPIARVRRPLEQPHIVGDADERPPIPGQHHRECAEHRSNGAPLEAELAQVGAREKRVGVA